MVKTDLVKAYKDNADYKPCTRCKEMYKGVPWVKKLNSVRPINLSQSRDAFHDFFKKTGRRFKLDTYPNKTLTVSQIKAKLDIWERQSGFVADVVAIDYADILVPEIRTDHRHQVNDVWQGLRNMTQERHVLGVTATQADSASYEKGRLKMINFSEDKRKLGHVTVMYGLNQDQYGRETDIGIMRINEIVKRTGASSTTREVKVLQNLSRGRPFLTSYW